MAEESDLEKTEPASPRRMEQAREDGDVPRSRELATCSVLLAAGLGFMVLGDGIVRHLNKAMVNGLTFDRETAFDSNAQLAQIATSLVDLLTAFAPFALLLVVVALASPMLIGGWLFSAKALQPDFARLSPFRGLGNMISTNAGVELLKAIAKTLLVGIVAWMVMSHQLNSVLALSVEPAKSGSAHLAHLMLISYLAIVGGLVVIALIDAPYQMWH